MADCTESKEDTNTPRLPAVMELDAVDESSENSANDDVEEQSCEENSRTKVLFNRKCYEDKNSGSTIMNNSTCPPSSGFKSSSSSGSSILRPSKLGGFSFNSSNSTTSLSTSDPLKTKLNDSNESNEDNEDINNDNDENTKSTSSLRDSILRPSQLGGFSFNSSNSTTSQSTSSSLESNVEKKTNHNDSNENNEDTNKDNDENTKNDEKNNKDDENNTSNTNLDDKKSTPLKFLPLLSNVKEQDNNTSNSMANKTSVCGFVFGEKLNERATVAKNDDNNDSDVTKNSDDTDDNNTIRNNTIDNDKVDNNDDDDDDDNNDADGEKNDKDKDENNENSGLFSTAATACHTTSRPGITLSQAAQEVEEANRANKRKYNEVALKTGEEDEINVLQINNAKLFTFDKETSGWKERGRGPLRLNDRDEESRLVGRTSGTQRLMLNTKVWPGMTAELAGPKSLRLTAMDILDDKVSGDIRIFIVQAAPKEVDELHELLIQRITRAKERQPKKIATGV